LTQLEAEQSSWQYQQGPHFARATELVARLRLGPLELEDAGKLVHSRIARWGPVEKNHIPLKRKQKRVKLESKGVLPKRTR
jgi:hypothetical protein